MKKFISILLALCLMTVPLNASAHSNSQLGYNTVDTSIIQSVSDKINSSVSTANVDLSVGTTTGNLDLVENWRICGWAWNDA